MPVLDYAIQDSILICAPHTPLREIMIYMGQAGQSIGVEDVLFLDAHSLEKSYRSLGKTVDEKLTPASNCMTIARKSCQNNEAIPLIDCVYIVEESHLLGIFTLADLASLITSGMNCAAVEISEVMQEPIITLEQDFDVNTTLSLMRQSGLRHFPIVDDQGQFSGIVTIESLALRLQQELTETRKQLECEMAKRCSLELALHKSEQELEKRVAQATEELLKTNQVLPGGIGNLHTTEAQILQTNSELKATELRKTNERLLLENIEHQRIERELRYRVEFEQLITTISTHFINLAPDEIDNGINQALQVIGEIANVERSYVYLFANNDIKKENTYEWCAKGFERQLYYLKNISEAVLPKVMEKLVRLETVYIPCVSEFIKEAISEQKAVEKQYIQSLIIVPIVSSGVLIGYLEFDSILTPKIWNEDCVLLLKMIGKILGNTLDRKRAEQALRVSKERYTRAISAGKVGIWEWNIQTNEIYIDPNLKAMLGYSEKENITYFEDWLKFVHPDDTESLKSSINDYLEGLVPKYEIEHRMLDKNGNYIWFLARGTLLRDAKGNPCFMAGSNTDITARIQVENKLKASLKEKDVLLKEIHHRVKNNLQIISSLLRLQAKYINDKQALEMFQDSHNRVRAMAMLHENLYQSNDLARIGISDYIQNVTNSLIRSYGVNRDIKIHLNIDKSLLKIDTAIPCGLIVNELISNSIKHAFTDKDAGDIYVDFIKLPLNKYLLNVSDNGVGLPQDIEVHKQQSLGLQLVWNLVEQLEGTIAFNTSLGTVFTITFVERN
ncbi:MAG: histidine kinase dimerization/phosphoacceptor domain -containing protein [Gloeotrichia echinulata DVL01]|jgi:PAS domain S-box-containing protein